MPNHRASVSCALLHMVSAVQFVLPLKVCEEGFRIRNSLPACEILRGKNTFHKFLILAKCFTMQCLAEDREILTSLKGGGARTHL